MNPIQITVTGRLGDDPRTFRTRCRARLYAKCIARPPAARASENDAGP